MHSSPKFYRVVFFLLVICDLWVRKLELHYINKNIYI